MPRVSGIRPAQWTGPQHHAGTNFAAGVLIMAENRGGLGDCLVVTESVFSNLTRLRLDIGMSFLRVTMRQVILSVHLEVAE